MRRRLVVALERSCNWTHWLTCSRVWFAFGWRNCPLALLSDWLDERWQTGVWSAPTSSSETGGDG